MLEIIDVKKTYNRNKKNPVTALNGTSFSLSKGETVAITGTSGSGKSTLLHILGCVLSFDSGKYVIDGKNIKDLSQKEVAEIRNNKIGIIFQNFLLIKDSTVYENVEIPLLIAKIKKKKRKELCESALKSVGISELSERLVSELSGGQQQRVAIARAIVNNAEYILADEPTGSLDSKNTEQIFELLNSIKNSNRGVLIVTHDLSLASKCDRQLCIEDGTIN